MCVCVVCGCERVGERVVCVSESGWCERERERVRGGVYESVCVCVCGRVVWVCERVSGW